MRYRRDPASDFSDRSVSPSFFFTAPARKPRTLCCCQPVATCSSSIVAPSGRLSRSRQVCCFVCFPLASLVSATSADALPARLWISRFRSCASFLLTSIGAGAWAARLRRFSSRQQDATWPLGGPPVGQPRLMRGAPTTQSPAVGARRTRPLALCLLGHQRRQHGRSLRERSPVLSATFGHILGLARIAAWRVEERTSRFSARLSQ